MGQLLYGDAIHIREQAKVDAARITQKSGNELRGAQTALQQFSSSLANNRAMKAAGSAYNAGNENIAANLDAAATGSFMSRIRAAEELGSSVAFAGAAGVGGSSVETYNRTLRLTEAMREEAQGRATAADLNHASRGQGAIIENVTAGLDNSVYRANLDYTQYVDHHKQPFAEKLLSVGLTAAATVFGGPQAGSAVMGMFEARQAARNGDYGSANQSFMGALQNGFQAYKTYENLGGDYWGSNKQPQGRAPTWGEPGHENSRAGTSPGYRFKG